MDAGQLNSRLHLQRRAAAGRDVHGNAQPGEFETVATVWANLAPRLGGEGVMGGRLQGKQPYVVTVRYSSQTRDITPAWRLEDSHPGTHHSTLERPTMPNTAPQRAVQNRLRALGYYDGNLDGVLGAVSCAAILRALDTVAANVVPPVVAGTLKVTDAGRALIASREGNKLRAYKDSRGILTIGVGHTSAAGDPVVTPGLVITAAQSDAILSRDLETFERAVFEVLTIAVQPHEFDALVSLAFNIGGAAFTKSSLVKKLNAGDRAGAANAFLAWSRAGKDKTILLSRRQAERKQFLGG